MTVRIRLQFDDAATYVDVPHLPRIGESIILPEPFPINSFRVSDVCHYITDPKKVSVQCPDVRVLGTSRGGPREPEE